MPEFNALRYRNSISAIGRALDLSGGSWNIASPAPTGDEVVEDPKPYTTVTLDDIAPSVAWRAINALVNSLFEPPSQIVCYAPDPVVIARGGHSISVPRPGIWPCGNIVDVEAVDCVSACGVVSLHVEPPGDGGAPKFTEITFRGSEVAKFPLVNEDCRPFIRLSVLREEESPPPLPRAINGYAGEPYLLMRLNDHDDRLVLEDLIKELSGSTTQIPGFMWYYDNGWCCQLVGSAWLPVVASRDAALALLSTYEVPE